MTVKTFELKTLKREEWLAMDEQALQDQLGMLDEELRRADDRRFADISSRPIIFREPSQCSFCDLYQTPSALHVPCSVNALSKLSVTGELPQIPLFCGEVPAASSCRPTLIWL
jgi:hypothetical protein